MKSQTEKELMIKRMADGKLIAAVVATPGVPVDPKLPEDWDCTPNDERPASHKKLWNRPYVTTPAGSGGNFFEVRRLDGRSWDRSTWCGSFESIELAMAFAKSIS